MGDALYPALHGLVGKRLHIEAAAEGHGRDEKVAGARDTGQFAPEVDRAA